MNGPGDDEVTGVDAGDRAGGGETYDAIVVGAGFAGLYMLHRLRRSGRRARVIEAGSDVGGTWYWNRYPGCRCDVPSMEYSYSFDDDLQQEWDWTEVMSPQPEILAYARHVADRFDLRDDITFDTRVEAAHHDEAANRWTVRTDAGEELQAPFLIMATGCLSASNTPALEGLDRFAGRVLHTGRWPHEPVDLSGRVGIIGTGSSGVQAIPVIAEQAAQLTVFQGTPVYTFPARNKPLRDDIRDAYKANYDEVRQRQRHSRDGFAGFTPGRERPATPTPPAAAGPTADRRRAPRPEIRTDSPEERRAAWGRYGFGVFTRYRDVYKDLEANELACGLYRDHVAEVVEDPEVAEALMPHYPLGCKRQVLDTGYYETFNRPNVALVDLQREPLVAITETGVQLGGGADAGGRHVELDVLVLATGFDAMTGALDRIDIRGRGGVALRDVWASGPRSYLGLRVAGFPNLFTITGPGSPSVLSNVIVAIEQHVEWIAGCIDDLHAGGWQRIETTEAAQEGWVEHVQEVAQGTMYVAPGCASWYLGANIEGKARTFMPYVGGMGRYRATCDEVVADGYRGFVRT